MTDTSVAYVAQQVRAALDAADLEQFAELLDPRVTWGAPGDPSPPCQSREQVLAWYAQGRADGRRARIRHVATNDDKIMVTMSVMSPDGSGNTTEADRWQVLTVANGRVTDIRGYDDEPAASAAAGLIA